MEAIGKDIQAAMAVLTAKRQEHAQKAEAVVSRSQKRKRTGFENCSPEITKLPSRPSSEQAVCERCQGMKMLYVIENGASRLIHCPDCFDFLAMSGLNRREQAYRIDSIQELAPVHAQLREHGRQMLDDPYGWLTLYGQENDQRTVTGSAKSLLAQAVVAEFCARGTRAVYYHAVDLVQLYYRDIDQDSSAGEDMLKRATVLAIDEIQSINPTDFIVGKLSALLDHRFRLADDLVTILVWQRHPETYLNKGAQWVPEAWMSRMRDGRFNRTAPDGGLLPGFMPVSAPDVRPYQKRG